MAKQTMIDTTALIGGTGEALDVSGNTNSVLFEQSVVGQLPVGRRVGDALVGIVEVGAAVGRSRLATSRMAAGTR